MNRPKILAALAATVGAAALTVPAGAAAPGAATAQTGLSVTPSILETTARRGATTATTVANTTGERLRITVRARPWRQTKSGAVVANRARRMRGLGLSASSFRLAPGARRTVHVTMGRTPAARSSFGALEVTGKRPKRRGINVAYRLVSSLRFNPAPAARRHAVRVGSAGVSGRTLGLLVRSTGNTVDPIGGRVAITGAGGGRSGSIGALAILPGKLVRLPVANLSGLRRGRYTARITLTQGGRNLTTVSKAFRIG